MHGHTDAAGLEDRTLELNLNPSFTTFTLIVPISVQCCGIPHNLLIK